MTLDQIANEYNRTKNPKLKELWYEKVKEWANGSDTVKRRLILFGRSDKTNDERHRTIC